MTIWSTLFFCSRWGSHAPVWTKMDTYGVIRHRGDEDEGTRWARTARQQRGRIGACTRGPASWVDLAVRVVRERNRFIPPLTVWLVGLPNRRVTLDEGSRANGWRKSRTRLWARTNHPWSLKPKGGSASGVLVRERGFFGFNRCA